MSLLNNSKKDFGDMADHLIVHESGTKDYHLYLCTGGLRMMRGYKFNEEEIVKLYNAIKNTLEREKLI